MTTSSLGVRPDRPLTSSLRRVVESRVERRPGIDPARPRTVRVDVLECGHEVVFPRRARPQVTRRCPRCRRERTG